MTLTGATLFTGGGGVDIGMEMAGIEVRWGVEYDPEIAANAQANGYPVTVADILECDPHDFEPVDVLHASPPCFPKGVTVLTEDGFRDISRIRVGDRVLTHRGRWRRVVNTMSREASTITLNGLGHWGLRVTPDHPFLASELYRHFYPHKERRRGHWYESRMREPKWVEAQDMVGRQWLSPAEYPAMDVPHLEYRGNEALRGQEFDLTSLDFWWLVGAWVGNGWVRYSEGTDHTQERGTVYICDAREEVSEIRKHLDGAGIRYGSQDGRTAIRLAIHSRPLARWLTLHFGKYAHGKKLPVWLLGQSEEIRQAFLMGYTYTDGHECHPAGYFDPAISASTVSRVLAIGLRALGLTLGYSVTIGRYERAREHPEIEGREIHERPNYVIRFTQSERHSRYVDVGGLSYRSGFVRTIDAAEPTTVYDITVEEDESFIADGIVVHNCPNFSVAKANGEETDTDRALAQKVVEFIEVLRPQIFTLENVYGYRKSESWQTIAEALYRLGYGFDYWHLCAADFGVPQTRNRMVVVALRSGRMPQRPAATHQNPTNIVEGQVSLFATQLPPWIGWYEAIEDLIPDLPDSEFAPWQLERLPTELVEAYGNALIQRQPQARGDGIYPEERPAKTINATESPPKAHLVCTQKGAERGKSYRDTEEPSETINTSHPPKGFIMDPGNSQRAYGESYHWEGEPHPSVQASQSSGKYRAFVPNPKALLIENKNGGRKATVLDGDSPSFTVITDPAESHQPKGFIVGGTPNNHGEEVTSREDDEPFMTVASSHNRHAQRAFIVGQNANDTSGVAIYKNEDAPMTTVRTEQNHVPKASVAGRVVQMTPRALARFQSFPDSYDLPESKTLACKIIGNAVPPLMYAQVIRQMIPQEIPSCPRTLTL